MKCDELKAETIVPQGSAITLQMYGKADVDAAIAELKARIHELESMPHTDNSAVIELLENEYNKLKEAYERQKDASMWRKCSEELPPVGVEVLVYYGKLARPEYYISTALLNKDITHWMPLPKAPEADK